MGRLSASCSTVDTLIPMADRVAVPAVSIRMVMGKIALIAADVAFCVFLAVVGVRCLSVSCSAGEALVPMIECVGFPVRSKIVGVGKLPLIAADIAGGALIVVVGVGLGGGFFSAGALLPVAECVGLPAVPKVVGVGRQPLIVADIAGEVLIVVVDVGLHGGHDFIAEDALLPVTGCAAE